VAAHRVLLRSGWYRRTLPLRPPVEGPFFAWPDPSGPVGPPVGPPVGVDAEAWGADADRVLAGELPVLADRWQDTGFPPAWHRSALTGVELDDRHRHWSDITDFGLPGGDIKGYWGPARFDGLLILALGWAATGRPDLRDAVERWLADWSEENPANAGIQWRCGQEAGIRLMHLLLVARLLSRWGGAEPTGALADLVAQHCERISATLGYAIGQDNNHGTSEAAALFAGGAFLVRHGPAGHGRRAQRWRRTGRRLLENRVARLVLPDGSFSQHSVNYHRVLLDTVSFAETWRRWMHEPPFSRRLLDRCTSATGWLAAFTDPVSGHGPNLGGNDGARLFVLHRLPFGDLRPSVRWAATVFSARPGYGPGPWDEPLAWLGLAPTPPTRAATPPPGSLLFADGGYARLAADPHDRAWLLLRLPVFRFRPSQSDALHLDLWVDGRNVVRDGGSYSYNADDLWLRYFSGVASHSTVQFDGRDQMPRLSRFLFGRWLTADDVWFDAAAVEAGAGYVDHTGAAHRRDVVLEPGRCLVTDTVAGFATSAVLRWRLLPGDWEVTDDGVRSPTVTVRVIADGADVIRRQLAEGHESRSYGRMTPLPVLEVEVGRPTTLVTEIAWSP
jgi:hypothetical protein